MQLRAIFTAADLSQALVHLAPIRLHFTEEDEDTRWVELERPKEATIVPGEGLRVVCAGRLRYTVQGVPINLELYRIQLLLLPQVMEPDNDAHRLSFHLRVEDLDIKYVPGVFDSAVTKTIDAAITPRSTQMVWKFGETLSHHFAIPSRLEPVDTLGLRVVGGNFEVTDSGMELTVDFAPLEVGRSSARPIEGRASPEA